MVLEIDNFNCYNLSMKKAILTLMILIVCLLLLPSKANAFSSYSIETQKFDTSLADQTATVYSLPEKIYITQITSPAREVSKNPSLWVKSLYYYYITRLALPDIPYTYMVDENGTIYQGKQGYQGANVPSEALKNAVLIGYLSNDGNITSRAQSSLREIVDSISKQWSIQGIKPVKLKITKEEGKLSELSVLEATGEFSTSINETFSNWKPSPLKPIPYKVKITSLEYPKESIIGGKIKAKVVYKNMNDFVWFVHDEPIYLSVKGGKESPLAVNKVWDSFSKPVSITDKEIKPGDNLEIEFELEAKVLVGEAQETFVLQELEGEPFEGSEFEVKFSVVKGDNVLVQVVSPKYGFLNIRKCNWASCEIIDAVKDGSVFILLEEKDGWGKIKYSEDIEGWGLMRYLKKI